MPRSAPILFVLLAGCGFSAVGSTHVVRVVLGTVPITGTLDLSQGIVRVVIRHPSNPERFVLVERVDLEALPPR